MPMNFPDGTLEVRASQRGFRPRGEGESFDAYRAALASHVERVDRIEAHEIRLGHGWDEWTPEQAAALVRKEFSHEVGCPICGDTRPLEPDGGWECPGCGTI